MSASLTSDPTGDLTAARYLCLAVPLALTLLAAATDRGGRRSRSGPRRRDTRQRSLGAALLAFIAAFVGIAGLYEVARLAGWYGFTPVAGGFRGLPVDVWIGWAVLWGPVPVLLRRWLPVPVALGVLFWLDVLAMPRLGALLWLGPDWLVGEVAGLVAVAVPAQLLGRWTAQRRHLAARALLQVVVFTGLTLWLLPTVAFMLGDGSWGALTGLPRPWLVLVGQVALLLAVPGLAAVRELVVRGHGTPYPWDPPRRLVTTGPYAYVANPMQVSLVALLLLLAAVTRSGTLAAGAASAAAFTIAVAAPQEREDLRRRFGPRWYAYRRQVRAWWPRLRPSQPPGPATLWLDPACPACRATAGFLHRRHPARLRIVPAGTHVRALWQARYEDRDGTVASGVGAVADGLGHLHLGWAYLGWLIRLPGIRPLAQVVTDALIAPPHPARACADAQPDGSRGARCPTAPSNGCSTGRSRRSGDTASPVSPPAPSRPPLG